MGEGAVGDFVAVVHLHGVAAVVAQGGAELRVELLRFLRPERKFADMAALHAQIERDIAAARAVPEL